MTLSVTFVNDIIKLIDIQIYPSRIGKAVGMGLTMRIFIINDDDTLRRLPNAKYERMLRGDPNEPLLEYADKRIRYALVIVDTENRKTNKIIRIEYSYLFFDSKGFLDIQEREREMQLGVNMVPPYGDEGKNSTVNHAEYKFAKKRYKERYRWIPSRELELAIIDAVFLA